MTSFDVVIVGSGHGGAQAAVTLRQRGFGGSIGIISEEQHLPYERPPLSKDYLSGTKAFERILLRPERFWAERKVTLLLGRRVVSVQVTHRTVTTRDSEIYGFGELIWAAGGLPRRLSVLGADLEGVHVVRTRDDVDSMMAHLERTREVVVIGGGYIGLEAAAVMVKSGRAVTVVEALPRVLARVAGEPLSRFFEAEHRAHGVDIRLEASVAAIEGDNGHVTGVRLGDGSVLPAQMVIVGIGIIPSVEPLLAAGAAGGNGVDIDLNGHTSLAHVYAIGDCAAHENAFGRGDRIRLESVQNATDQAVTVALSILDTPEPYRAVPWFWSQQYDLKLQTVGLSTGYDEMIIRGDPCNRAFSLIYLHKGRVIALDCVNSASDYMQGRHLVKTGMIVDPAKLADPATPLKELS